MGKKVMFLISKLELIYVGKKHQRTRFFHGSRVNTAYETHTLASACLLCSNCLGSDCFYNTRYFVNGFLKSSYSYLLLQVLYGWQIIFNHLSSVLFGQSLVPPHTESPKSFALQLLTGRRLGFAELVLS